MKQSLTLIFLAITFVSFSQGTIEGYVIDSTTGKPLPGARLTLLTIRSIKLDSTYELTDFITNNKSRPIYYYDTSWTKVKIAYTDSSGYYHIDSIGPNNYKVLSFFKIREDRGRIIGESDYSSLFQLTETRKHPVDFRLGVFCSYDITKKLVECPKCHDSAGVRIQVYGLPGDMENALKDDGKHYYNGFCVVTNCQPSKICLRCNTQF